MIVPDQPSDIDKVVLNTVALDENALRGGDEFVNIGG
jgi:hypothetical protein